MADGIIFVYHLHWGKKDPFFEFFSSFEIISTFFLKKSRILKILENW